MASIKIDSDLRPIGSELFLDSESYLEELSADQQINKIVGGTSISIYFDFFSFLRLF
ncbi:hypothetical protein MiTe_04864 [Microcystis aeruginosa NIES-2520]|uniref:Uncharacterized protein n=1 Tax=Microcystis aeruginosa NIES-2520 TaxID=2303982 RepID=A0A5A5RXN7_MICAE|nr:hypothetical protein MiTe_04864 [Microcystis aeruginosa NIES-2520]